MKLFLIGLGLTLGTISIAQDFKLENYNTEQGLPSSELYDVIEDDFGYLWIATDKGLSRYNGYEFENFDKNDGLISNVIFDFHKRPNGNIWCTTNTAELLVIKGNTPEPEFGYYIYNDTIRKYIHNLIPQCLYFTASGGILMTFNNRQKGFLKLSADGKVHVLPEDMVHVGEASTLKVLKDTLQQPFFFLDTEDSYDYFIEDIPYSSSSDICKSYGKEALFVGEQGEIFSSESGIEVKSPFLHQAQFDKGNKIIASGRTGDYFWLGYRHGGVAVYTTDGKEQFHVLKELSVSQFYIDKEENIWITTLEKGLFRSSSSSIKYLNNTQGQVITSLTGGENGELYVGDYNGRILVQNKDLEFSTYYENDRKHIPALMTYDHDEGVNYFSSDHLFSSCSPEEHISFPVKYIHYNDHKLYYHFRENIQLDLLTGRKAKFFHRKKLTDVEVFHSQLYGGDFNGLSVSDTVENAPYFDFMTDVRINDLNTFANRLIIGTNGAGMMLMDSCNTVTHHFTTEDGLNSNFISKSFSENDSILWVCTNNGLDRIRFNADTLAEIYHFTTKDGLLSNEILDVFIQHGTIWVGTQNGLNFFKEDIFSNKASSAKDYNLKWTTVEVNDKSVDSSYSFSYDENKIKFSFEGISFKYEEKLQYRFKLKDIETEWNYTDQRNVTYSALPPCSYELLVEVKGDNENWKSNRITYQFSISPPFWRAWWFVLLSIITAGSIIVTFFKLRILTYNKDLVREILRHALRKIRKEPPSILIKQHGKELRLETTDIHFIKTNGNYLEVYSTSKIYIIRSSIKKLMEQLPDPLEFIQVHRSYVVRLEHIEQKSRKELFVLEQKIPVGRKYQSQIDLITI